MKKLILVIVLAAAFFAGYYLGNQPDSPDLLGWARNGYSRAAQAAQQLASALRGGTDAAPHPAR